MTGPFPVSQCLGLSPRSVFPMYGRGFNSASTQVHVLARHDSVGSRTTHRILHVPPEPAFQCCVLHAAAAATSAPAHRPGVVQIQVSSDGAVVRPASCSGCTLATSTTPSATLGPTANVNAPLEATDWRGDNDKIVAAVQSQPKAPSNTRYL